VTDGGLDPLYEAFGRLVQLHRKRTKGMTQEKLGSHVGLSRTSITNIEKGRQHVSLHQLFAIAQALKVAPETLLPSLAEGSGTSWLAEKLPPGTEREITQWADKLVSRKTETETR
jgi:transcriptional regulator with XRE-family HTH domain